MLNPSDLRARGIAAVLFDKDGTLVDSLGPWADAERTLAEELVRRRLRRPETADQEVERIAAPMLADIGIVGEKADRNGLWAAGTTSEILNAMRRRLETAFGVVIDRDAFASEASAILNRRYPGGGPEIRAMPGADRTLAGLREAGFPLGVATSDDRERALADLGRFGWLDRFVFFSFGDTAAEPKPSPRPALEFARVVGVLPSAVAVVGDTEADQKMAVAAGAGLFVRIIDGFH